MDVGLMMIFASYGWDNIGDDQVWDEDLRWRAKRRRSASTCCGRPSTISSTIRLIPLRGHPLRQGGGVAAAVRQEVLPVLKSWQSPAAKAAE